MRRYCDALDKNDGDACANLCRFPLIEVGVGAVTRIEDGAKLAQQVNERTTSVSNIEVEAAQSGPRGVLVAVTADDTSGNSEQSIVVVSRSADAWQIAGISRML